MISEFEKGGTHSCLPCHSKFFLNLICFSLILPLTLFWGEGRCSRSKDWIRDVSQSTPRDPERVSLVLCIYLLPFSLMSRSYSPPPRTIIVMGLLYAILLECTLVKWGLLLCVCVFLNLCQWYWVVMSVLLGKLAREPPCQDPSSPSRTMSSSRGDLLILHSPWCEGAHVIHSFNKKKGNNIAQWLRTQALRSNAL